MNSIDIVVIAYEVSIRTRTVYHSIMSSIEQESNRHLLADAVFFNKNLSTNLVLMSFSECVCTRMNAYTMEKLAHIIAFLRGSPNNCSKSIDHLKLNSLNE